MSTLPHPFSHPSSIARAATLLAGIATLAVPTPSQEGSVHVNFHNNREVRQSKLLTLGKTDRWELKDVKAGEFLWCTVDSTAFDPVLSLVDSDGTVIATDDGEGTKSMLRLRCPSAGAFSLQVKGYEGSGGGNYSFWLQRYPIAPMAIGAEASHRFNDKGWHHWAVELEAGQVVVPVVWGNGRLTSVFDLEQRPLQEKFGGRWVERTGTYFFRVEGGKDRDVRMVCLLAEQGPMPTGGPGSDTMPPHGMRIWRTTLQAGQAWQQDLAFPHAVFKYVLRERPGTAPKNARGPAFVWSGSLKKGGRDRGWLVARRRCEVELIMRHNGAVRADYTATLAPTGESVAMNATVESILPMGGGRLFTINSQPGQLLRIAVESDAFDARLDLWDPQGNVLSRVDDKSLLDRNAEITFLVERPGMHRFLAYSNGGGAAAFSARVEEIPIPVLSVDQPVSSDLKAGETRYFHLHVPAGRELWLSSRSAACDSAITVLSPHGERLGCWEGGGVGHNALAAFAVRHGGRHTVMVHGRRGAGPCRVQALSAGL